MHSCVYSADRLPLQKVLKHRADFMGTLNETMAPYLFCLTYEQLCMSWWCSPTPLIRLSIFGKSIVLVLRIATTPSISIMTALFANVDVLKGLSYYSESTFTINTVIADYLIDFFFPLFRRNRSIFHRIWPQDQPMPTLDFLRMDECLVQMHWKPYHLGWGCTLVLFSSVSHYGIISLDWCN